MRDFDGARILRNGRKRLLQIFHERCRELGVEIEFEREIDSLAEFADADLILASDGINSFIREAHAEHLSASLDWRPNMFCWLGTTLPLDAFTFIFETNEHGLFQIHAYPFEKMSMGAERDLGTFHRRVQSRNMGARRTGQGVRGGDGRLLRGALQRTSERASAADQSFALASVPDDQERVLAPREHRPHGRLCSHRALLDRSGTKLAMEDAIALTEAFKTCGLADVPKRCGVRGVASR